ncbi:MAG: DUF1778 domain-containing protein [Acetobacteraceae bacterium]|nr:DUF1778 domain-containing protein [Acetobacteraceae bacterium]
MAGPKRAASRASASRASLNIRIRPEERGLIDRAARATGKTRTDFILEASRRAAEEALLDRVMFAVEPSVFRAFLDRLEQPVQPNPRLRCTMVTLAPWDEA